MAEQLQFGTATHVTGFHDFGADFLQAECRHQDHRRNRVDCCGDCARGWAYFEEDHSGQQVGEERQRLQY